MVVAAGCPRADGLTKDDAVFIGLPAVIGGYGVEQVIELTSQKKET